MKKIICLSAAFLLCLLLFISCSDEKGDTVSYGSAPTISYGELLSGETSVG